MRIYRLTLLALLFSSFAYAEGSEFGREFNLQAGTALPDQIKGVTELLPTWGFFYKIPMAGAGLEIGILDSHANGVDFTTLPVRGRFDIPIDNFLTAIAFAGPEVNYYSEVNSTNRQTVVGFHFGGGAMYHVLETLWLRVDLKYSVNPGDSLYFGFGFSFRSSDVSGGS